MGHAPEDSWERVRAVLPITLRWRDELADLHATPVRHYHTLSHALAVAHQVCDAAPWAQPREVMLAALYHDAVYVAGASDNEARSAQVAADAVARWVPDVDVDRVRALIVATAAHGRLGPDDVDGELARFLDCDTSILGASEPEFDAYDRGVAAEWATVVTPDAYRQGRGRFLEGLVARERIFLSPSFHARLDAPARTNLRRALARLG